MITYQGKVIIAYSLIAITAFFSWNLQYLTFDFEFEKFFPKNHPESRLYQKHVDEFGYDNDFMQIILQNEGSVFDTSFLKRAIKFEKDIKKIQDVEQVFSPLSLQHAVKSPTGLIIFPLIHANDPSKLKTDSIRIFGNSFYGSAFSKNGDAVSIYLGHAHFDDPIRSEAILSSIEKKAAKHQLHQIRLVGKLKASGVFIRYIRQDFGKFLLGSFMVSFSLLLLIFRSFKSASLPFLISLISIIWLFGLMGLLGQKINLLSTLIPPILFFVSMSDAVHFMNALKKIKTDHKKDQLMEALRIVCPPTFLTSVTTAIGFLSLVWISTEPVQQLGIFAAIGILIAFFITFTLGLLIASFSGFSSASKVIGLPIGFPVALVKKKRTILLVTLLSLCLVIPGIFQLKVNAFLLDDLPEDSQVRQDFEYADKNLGGSKPYEIRVEVADSTLSIWDKSVLDEMMKIEDYLLNEYPVANVQSPATIIKYLTMVNNGGLNQHYRNPESVREYRRTLRLKNRIDPKRMDKLVTEDGKVARLIGFFPELGSYETGKRNRKLLAYLDANIDRALLNYQITGTTHLIDKSHELLSLNLIQGLLAAIVVIGVTLGLYFKSWKLLIISLIPNLIPLLMVAGIIGWLGISLKMTTSIIFAVVFGIAVDDTIHMMSYYLQNNRNQKEERISNTFKHAGSAMLITTIIMCAGFCLFLFSSFGATYYVGLFLTLSLFIAVLVDLTILPLLLLWFTKNAEKGRSDT
ncbi:MAG: efflux RND transporter permease subunit [Bacteroidota bacterium]